MELAKYVEEKRKMERDIKLAVDHAVHVFRLATSYCPGKIEIELLDVTKYCSSQGAEKWARKKSYETGMITTVVEM